MSINEIRRPQGDSISAEPIIAWILTGRVRLLRDAGRALLALAMRPRWLAGRLARFNLAVPTGGLRLYGRANCSATCWKTSPDSRPGAADGE